MTILVWNFILALVWAATTEEFSARNFAIGMVLGFALLFLTRRVLDSSDYFRNLREIVELVWFFIKELVLSNFRMAYYTIMPLNRMRPGVIAVPLEPMSDVELTVLSNLLTLTPGTLSLDSSKDKRTLYVHVMWFDDPEKIRREIKEGFEKAVIKGLRSEYRA
jgi:multicomponent Na+:H+ antiporter subunit E